MPGTIQDQTSIELYLRDINNSQPLSHEEEIQLAQQMRKGNREARDKLVSANLRFVVSMAREYQHYGVPMEDLIATGNLGLMEAAKRFDETLGYKFISYAVWWVRQAMNNALIHSERSVRLPVNRIELLHKIRRIARELRQTHETEPTPEAIADALNVSREMVTDTLVRTRMPRSLEAPLRGEQDDYGLLQTLPDSSQPLPDAEAIENSTRALIQKMLNTLEPREAEVLQLYFGLNGRESLTLEQIGNRFHITRERARQIKQQGLQKLQHPRRRKSLESVT